MRKLTTCVAMMLAVTLASSAAPKQATAASLWGALVELTSGSSPSGASGNMEVWNNGGRTVMVDVYGDYGYVGGGVLNPGESLGAASLSSSSSYAVRVSVWNNGRWVAKDFDAWGPPGPFFIEIYKVRRGVFQLRRW